MKCEIPHIYCVFMYASCEQEIYEIYHNGNRFVAEEIIRHETGSNVVMNCAVSHDGCRSYLVAGQESHCQLYFVQMKVTDEEDGVAGGGSAAIRSHQPNGVDGLRNRRSSMRPSGTERVSTSTDPMAEMKHIRFDIKAGDSVQTDFSAGDPLQRVVRLSPNGKLMATGGTDGHIRLWSFPRMVQVYDISTHTKEIDDLDFSSDSKRLISIAKDGLAIVWNAETGKESIKLNWEPPEGTKYLFKRCRFGVYEGKIGKSRLFTIANPFGKVGKQVKCVFLVKMLSFLY